MRLPFHKIITESNGQKIGGNRERQHAYLRSHYCPEGPQGAQRWRTWSERLTQLSAHIDVANLIQRVELYREIVEFIRQKLERDFGGYSQSRKKTQLAKIFAKPTLRINQLQRGASGLIYWDVIAGRLSDSLGDRAGSWHHLYSRHAKRL